MYYVYIIKSTEKQDEFYTGFSTDLKQRMSEHNSGKSKHTSKYTPWKLIFYCSFENKETAINFEKYLKSSSGIAFRNKRLIYK